MKATLEPGPKPADAPPVSTPGTDNLNTTEFLSHTSWGACSENARTSRLFWAEDQADTDLLIEDSLLDGLEEPDELAAQVEIETAQAEPTKGVHYEYLYSTLNALKSQIAKHKRPDCYRNGTFWVRPRDPIFALDHAWATTPRFSPTELYHLPVFAWLPDFIRIAR
ncbi:hypothetical protein HGRIS_002872 [Hohenbuehelia grisea]|uniref:Uncharacterized protein n=1 Tax=Hohenbuehelia grisea TaxID=104357 RepID=A0ABR3JN74_9AGAR